MESREREKMHILSRAGAITDNHSALTAQKTVDQNRLQHRWLLDVRKRFAKTSENFGRDVQSLENKVRLSLSLFQCYKRHTPRKIELAVDQTRPAAPMRARGQPGSLCAAIAFSGTLYVQNRHALLSKGASMGDFRFQNFTRSRKVVNCHAVAWQRDDTSHQKKSL
jgi:hypothetical protein